MRIFVAGTGLLNKSSAIGYWHRHLVEPLLEMGHEVVESGIDCDEPLLFPDRADWAAERPKTSERLVEEVRRAHAERPIHLFLSYFYSINAEPAAIRVIRDFGIPTVNFFCDAAHSFHLVREIAPAYDWCWVTERQALPYYLAAGAHPLHLQMAANPKLCCPVEGFERDIDVLFAGRLYADRPLYLKRLLDDGFGVRIHTPDICSSPADMATPGSERKRNMTAEAMAHWRQFGSASLVRRFWRMTRNRRTLPPLYEIARPAVYGAQLNEIVARSAAALNFCGTYNNNDYGGTLLRYVKLRDFEIPMSRALFFPQYCDELAECFEIGKEVIAWTSYGELKSRLSHFLKHPKEAEAVRQAGYRRAINEHTWQARYRQLFATVFGRKFEPGRSLAIKSDLAAIN